MYHESYDNQTKWMQVLIEDYDLLKNYNEIWNKVNADIKKELDRFCLEKKKKKKIQNQNLIMIKLYIFTIKKCLMQALIMLIQQ